MSYVGIDVSKDRLDVHVPPAGGTWTSSRDAEGLAALAARLGAPGPACIGLKTRKTVAELVEGCFGPSAHTLRQAQGERVWLGGWINSDIAHAPRRLP